MPKSIVSNELTVFPDENGADETKYAKSWEQGAHPILMRVVG